LVAVDVSDSMGVRDPQREPVEKLRLARALKLAGDLCSGDRLDDWIEQYEAKKPIQWVKDDEFKDDAEGREKAEAERRKAHDEWRPAVDPLTPSEAARQLLSPDGVRLLARISANHKLELIGFAGAVKDATPDALDKLFKKADDKPPAAGEKKVEVKEE